MESLDAVECINARFGSGRGSTAVDAFTLMLLARELAPRFECKITGERLARCHNAISTAWRTPRVRVRPRGASSVVLNGGPCKDEE